MKIEKERCVSFSGHRSYKMSALDHNLFSEDAELLESRLQKTIEMFCAEGYHTFLCGMAEGFDLLAGEIVVNLKEKLPHIKLIAIIPHPNQAIRFDNEAQATYSRVISAADSSIIISSAYKPNCYHLRNDFMVENSSSLICCFNGSKGGTAYTVKKAVKAGLRVINVLETV